MLVNSYLRFLRKCKRAEECDEETEEQKLAGKSDMEKEL